MTELKVDISIIIINYNRSNYIERCLRSCIDQIIFNKSYEIIFVDDGSKDNSFKIAKKFASSIRLFKLKKNKGISYAANFALKKSKGKFFIRVDSDDFINKHAIDFMSQILEKNNKIALILSSILWKFFQARYLNFQNNFNGYDCLDQRL